jgi:ribosomal protein S18 acetylase RimI-like enzyme
MTQHAVTAGSRELARRIQASILDDACRARDTEHVGPFVATFDRNDPNPFLNYAIPAEDATPTKSEVDALAQAYRRRNRKPRLEYLPLLAPAVEAALLAGGFSVEGRLPLMTSASGAKLREATVEGIELVAPATEQDYRDVASVQWEAYKERGAVPQRVVDSLRRSAEAGGVVLLAREAGGGEPTGAGQCTALHDGVCELTSVGVRERFRRRGIARALAARLAGRAFANGAEGVFLMAHGKAEARIYERAGFAHEGEVLLVSQP